MTSRNRLGQSVQFESKIEAPIAPVRTQAVVPGIPGLTVIIPALNEAAGIFRTMLELKLELQEIGGKTTYLVVDGHSKDDTGRIAHRLGAVVLEQEGIGKGDAIRQALSHVPESTEYAVLMDADFTYPARYIPDMITLMESDSSIGMVSGNRFGNGLSKKLFKRSFYLGNRLLAIVQAVANRVLMEDPLSGLRIVRYDLLKDWTPKSLGFDIEVELNHHVVSCGYSIREIPIQYRTRVGVKKLRRRDGITILHRMISQTMVRKRVASLTDVQYYLHRATTKLKRKYLRVMRRTR